MSPKDRLHANIDSELNRELEELVIMYEEKTKIKVTKTQVLEAAIKEGLEVLKRKLEEKKVK